jgi:hypothetical protein
VAKLASSDLRAAKSSNDHPKSTMDYRHVPISSSDEHPNYGHIIGM